MRAIIHLVGLGAMTALVSCAAIGGKGTRAESASFASPPLLIAGAPMVLPTEITDKPPQLGGGTIPPVTEYVLTAVTIYHAGDSRPRSANAGERYQERLHYFGSNWEAVFLHDGAEARWGGTYTIRDNTLTSVLTFGLRAGETLVDTYSVSAKNLIVQFGHGTPRITQLTFTRQR